jgi:hypothetical protein
LTAYFLVAWQVLKGEAVLVRLVKTRILTWFGQVLIESLVTHLMELEVARYQAIAKLLLKPLEVLKKIPRFEQDFQ